MFKQLILSFFLVLGASVLLLAQPSVFPGDSNANGIVDQYDIPSIGYAMGNSGSARIQQEDQSYQGIPEPWEASFPSGVNYIHADVDGNGVVNLLDFFGWNVNFGLIHDEITPLAIPEESFAGSASLVWNEGLPLLPLTGGQQVDIPFSVALSNEAAVNGLAFRLKYHPGHFQSASLSLANNWLVTDNEGIALQKTATGQMDVGATRFGENPLAEGGNCGTLGLIIIDDMIGLLETPADTLTTFITIEKMLLVNGQLDTIPVAIDSFPVKLYRSGTVSTTLLSNLDKPSAVLYPNPTAAAWSVEAAHVFSTIRVTDAVGRLVQEFDVSPRQRWTWPGAALLPGTYYVTVCGTVNSTTLKLLQY